VIDCPDDGSDADEPQAVRAPQTARLRVRPLRTAVLHLVI
jgi:hypothetical protein